MLKLNSNKIDSLVRLPIESGIGPVNWLELSNLKFLIRNPNLKRTYKKV